MKNLKTPINLNKSVLNVMPPILFSEMTALSQKLKEINEPWFERIHAFEKFTAASDALKNLRYVSVTDNAVLPKGIQWQEFLSSFYTPELRSSLSTAREIIKNFQSTSYRFFADVEEEQEYAPSLETKDQTSSGSILLLQDINFIQKAIAKVYRDYHELYRLSPRDFEKMIAELMSAQGMEVELTKQTRDGGYDIMAIQNLAGHLPLKYLVECKRNAASRKIGVNVIRSFSHVIEKHAANRGIIVTTSVFTLDAKNEQRANPYRLDLRDKDDVLNWVRDYQIKTN